MKHKKLSSIKRMVKNTIDDFSMINKGDKLLLGVSGGKDSMALADILADFQEVYSFHLKVCYIKGSYDGNNHSLPEEIRMFFYEKNIDYCEESMNLNEEDLPMNCKRCSFNRRKTLFVIGDKLGCNKIAVGHNKNDLAETVLMNIFTGGNCFSYLPISDYFHGKFYLIRPFYYVSTSAIISYVRNHNIPVLKNSCPLSETAGRSLMRHIISIAKDKYPQVEENILKLENNLLKN